MPKVKKLIWDPYQLPLIANFNTAHQRLAFREGIIVEIYTDVDIIGVGEIAPLPEFAGGSMQDALTCLPLVANFLRDKPLPEALQLLRTQLNTIPSAAMYGVETALLDAQGRFEQRSLSFILAQASDSGRLHATSVRSSLAVNAVIGTMSVEAAVERARQAVTEGFGCIKLKVGRDVAGEVERVAAVRAAVGPAIELRLDANEGWTFEQARAILTRCTDYAIQYVEQPLARADLAGMRALRGAVPVPIAADEVLSDLASAERVLEAEAADVFIIKPQLAGGILHAQRMLQLAGEHGIECVITSSIEAGIGVAAALHLAAASEIKLACGLATLPMLQNDLIHGALPVSKGHMRVPAGAGLGVALDRVALAQFSSPYRR